MERLGERSLTGVAYGAVLLFSLLVFWYAWTPVLLLLGILAYLELFRLLRRFLRGVRLWLALAAGTAYLFVGLSALAALQFAWAGEAGAFLGVTFGRWALLALLVTWASDVGAYLVGSAIGRRRIAPRLSPGKTFEGTVAGLAGAAAVALLVGAAYGLSSPAIWLVALLAGPAGLASDLLESAVKRAAGVKDSGGILPGHGGALDRIDSLLAIAPVVYAAFLVARSGMMGR